MALVGEIVQAQPATRPAVSIVVRAKNEEALLGETLTRLHSQSFRDAEIVLVDSGSTDRTLDIARSFPAVRIVEIDPEEFTFGRALNVGCEQSRGETLVFLSAHAWPASDHWLARLLGHFADRRVVGVWGGQRPREAPEPPPRILRQDLAMFLGDVYFGFNNANSAMRKAIWEKYPFNEGLAGSEDKEWAYRVLSDGHVLMHDRQAFIYHDHEESLGQVWWRAHREHLGYAHFLPRYRVGIRDLWQYAYPRMRTLWRTSDDPDRREGRLLGETARIVASSLGRYTGSRKWLAGPRAEFRPRPARENIARTISLRDQPDGG
jgi:rhamnosyltransferase